MTACTATAVGTMRLDGSHLRKLLRRNPEKIPNLLNAQSSRSFHKWQHIPEESKLGCIRQPGRPMTLSKIPTLDSNMCPDDRWHLDVQMTRSHHLPTPTHTHKSTHQAATLLGQLHAPESVSFTQYSRSPEGSARWGLPRVTEARNL